MTLNELKENDEFEVVDCKSPRLKEMGFFKWACGKVVIDNGSMKSISINGYKVGVDNFESRDIIVNKKGDKE